MKFIISSMSLGMFLAKDFNLKVHELTEEEFQALGFDAYSCIGHEDIANITGFAYNHETVKARPGDILLVAQKYKGILKFHCIQIMESHSPLLREDELYAEEEMI